MRNLEGDMVNTFFRIAKAMTTYFQKKFKELERENIVKIPWWFWLLGRPVWI
jgi:hypothetical protein